MTTIALAAAALLLAMGLEATEIDLWAHGRDPLHEKYEQLYEAKYPHRGIDPFNRLRPFNDVREFNKKFDQRLAGVWTRTDQTADQVWLLIGMPGLASEPMDVSIDKGQIRVSPTAAAPEQIGRWRFRTAAFAEQRFALPPHADASTAKVSRDGDTIRVLFSRRADQ